MNLRSGRPILAPRGELASPKRPAPAKQGEQGKEREVPEAEEHTTISDDPAPPSAKASAEKIEKYRKEIKEYSKEMYAAYQRNPTWREDNFWADFATAFRPETIKLWTRTETTDWAALLNNRGIQLVPSTSKSRTQAIIDVLFWKEYQKGAVREEEQPGAQVEENITHETEEMTVQCIQVQDTKSERRSEVTDRGTGDCLKVKESAPNPDPPGDDSDEDEAEDWEPSGRDRDHSSKALWGQKNNQGTQDERRSLGVQGMMKAYVGKDKFKGSWHEDLNGCFVVFETMAKMCNLTHEEMLEAIPVMLDGGALRTFSQKGKDCATYLEAVGMLKLWYNSPDKRSRILTAWQTMRLTAEMEKSPGRSEVDVFREFVNKLTSLQQQLDERYHGDHFLRDRLLTAVDIPVIQSALRDRMPRTSQQAINRVASKLSEEAKTAGTSSSANIAVQNEELSQAMFTLGQKYSKGAKRNIKRYGPKRPPQNGRRLSGSWLRGVKGCFVCGQDHRANQRHNREEVTEAIRKLKSKHATALLTVEDLDSIWNAGEQDGSNSCEEGNEAQWAEDDDEDSTTSVEDEGVFDIAYVATEELQRAERSLANTAYLHGLPCNLSKSIAAMHAIMGSEPADEATRFQGLRIDTCANRRSIICSQQYQAYCREFGLGAAIRKVKNTGVIGIGGRREAEGLARIQVPFATIGIVIDVDFMVIAEPIPTLLSTKDMVENHLDISLTHRRITFQGRHEPLRMENYFLIHRWKPSDLSFVLYTETELRHIHRTFGHPTIRATKKLLERAKGSELGRDVKEAIERIQKDCSTCLKTGTAPRRFKLTVGTRAMRFNHQVQVDTMFIGNEPIVHMVDEATHFTAARFVRDQSARTIWTAIQDMWSLTYMGPPDHISVDQGSSYVSREMKENMEAQGIQMHEAPIETPGSIGIVERYHAPLRAAYEKIRTELREPTRKEEILKLAVHAVNSSVGPEGLCPILLVFGAIPRPARRKPAPTQIQRAMAVESAVKAAHQVHAKRRLAFAKRHPQGPKGVEASSKLRRLPAGSPVLVYRSHEKRWKGPYKFISIEGETAVVQLDRGRKIFRSSSVRPWIESRLREEEAASGDSKDDQEAEGTEARGAYYSRLTKKKDTEEHDFSKARVEEIKGLIDNGTFQLSDEREIPKGNRVFGSRFVDEVKKADKGIRLRSRLIAQNYNDEESAVIATKAPTVQRFTQRVALSIAASKGRKMKTYLRDVTQAYVQAASKLERKVYIRPPKEMGLPEHIVLLVVKPLYGVPESGLHWYLTFLEYHLTKLQMKRSRVDPCMLVKHEGDEIEAVIVLQVDDSLGIGTTNFLIQEEAASKTFRCKERKLLEDGEQEFNGTMMTKGPGDQIWCDQRRKIERLKPTTNQKEFISQRALAQYIGVTCRPDICAPVQLIAPGSETTTAGEHKTLKKVIQFLEETAETPLKFVQLDLSTVKLVVISDASFANARGGKSQLGFLILMVDADAKANIVHFASNRCKRVTRSVMAAEIHALVLAYDTAFVIADMLKQILCRDIDIEVVTDSKTLFDVVAKDGKTAERRLQIDILALREAYARKEVGKIIWIPGQSNPADALTKEKIGKRTPLWTLMQENRYAPTSIGKAETMDTHTK